MKVIEGTIRIGSSTCRCLKMGEGSKLLLAFHGFGLDATMFLPIAKFLSDDYTIIAIDLPYHGKTEWNDSLFTIEDLMALVQGFKNDIGVETLSLIGYSLGAKLCLQILISEVNWIEAVYLLAPDGIKNSRFYKFCTNNSIGKFFFKQITEQPAAFLGFINMLGKWNFLDEKRRRFIRNNLDDDMVRKQVYESWMVLRKVTPHKSIVYYNIKKNAIPFHLFMGKYDAIVSPNDGRRYISGLKTAELHLLDCGHNLLKEEYMKTITTIIKSYAN